MKIKDTKLIIILAAFTSMILVGCQGGGGGGDDLGLEEGSAEDVSPEEQAEAEAYEKEAGGSADQRKE